MDVAESVCAATERSAQSLGWGKPRLAAVAGPKPSETPSVVHGQRNAATVAAGVDAAGAEVHGVLDDARGEFCLGQPYSSPW